MGARSTRSYSVGPLRRDQKAFCLKVPIETSEDAYEVNALAVWPKEHAAAQRTWKMP